jgi:hypothetical protein
VNQQLSIALVLLLISPTLATAAEPPGPTTTPATSFVASSAGPWIATLPSGVTVELVAVSRHPIDADGWWKPDGSPMTDPPPAGLLTEKQYSPGPDDSHKLYKFFLRYHTPDGKQRVMAPRMEGEDANYVFRPIAKDYFFHEIVMPVPTEAKVVAAIRQEVGLPGIERLIDTPSPALAATFPVPETNGQTVTFQPKPADDGRYAVTIDCPTDLLAHDSCRPVVTVKNKEFLKVAEFERTNPTPQTTRLTYTMDTPADGVQRFRVEVFRAREYARFTNICLDPAEPTAPTAEGRKGDRWPKGIRAR